LCAVSRKRPEIPVSPEAKIEVLDPAYAHVFANQTQVRFRWVPFTDAAIVVLVVERISSSLDQLSPIWGAERSLAEVALDSAVAWEAGSAIVDRQWRSASIPVPIDATLFVVVQAFREGRRVAASLPVPFKVGSPFPAPGDGCASNADCNNPAFALDCVASVCSVRCGSSVDCQPFGTACGVPTGTLPRYCE
jgi:hypothetical protein